MLPTATSFGPVGAGLGPAPLGWTVALPVKARAPDEVKHYGRIFPPLQLLEASADAAP
jgi:hypothetical protein